MEVKRQVLRATLAVVENWVYSKLLTRSRVDLEMNSLIFNNVAIHFYLFTSQLKGLASTLAYRVPW